MDIKANQKEFISESVRQKQRMGIIVLFFFLVFIPTVIGSAVARILSLKGSLKCFAALPMGFFLELSLLQLLTFPWALFNFSFSSLCMTFICILCMGCTFSLLYCRRVGQRVHTRLSFSKWDWIYGMIAFLLICWQLYNMIYSDIGYWSSDDASYGAMANDILVTNTLFRNNAYTGISGALDVRRALQSSIVFPAFLAFVSGLSVAIIFHTVLGIYYLLLAYVIYACLGKVLFKTLENVFAFIIVLSILYIFGLYTIYSQTYRLLGPSTQGKAILAVSFFPFLYTLLIIKLPEEYNKKFGLILLFLSASAVGMTLFGTITMIGNVAFPVLISMIGKKRDWRRLRYILWGSILPVSYCGIFFYYLFLS